MKIDNINMEDIYRIEYNYNNLEILKICSYLIGLVMNETQALNDASDLNNELVEYLDLGNSKKIKREDYESLWSILDTLSFIRQYNEEQ